MKKLLPFVRTRFFKLLCFTLCIIAIFQLGFFTNLFTHYNNNKSTDIQKKDEKRILEWKDGFTYFPHPMGNNQIIPRIIHQTYSSKTRNEMTSGMKNATLTYASNSQFKYVYYNNDEVLQFLIDNYGKESVEYITFNNIIPFAYKIDFWRLALLYKIGGFYADVDSVLLKKELNTIIENNATIVLPVGYATEFLWFGFDYAFIGSIPQHPLLRIAMDMIIYNVKNKFIPEVPRRLDEIWFFKYFTITGPILMGKAFNRYMNEPDEVPHNIVKGRSLGVQFLGFCEANRRKYFTTIPHQRNIKECRGEVVIQFAYDEYWDEREKTRKTYWRHVLEGTIFR